MSESEKLLICEYLSKSDLLNRERKRFTMIILSSEQKMPIKEIAASCSVSENTVKKWFERYEAQGGAAGLLDLNMVHSQSSLAVYDAHIIMGCVQASAQNLRQAVAVLAEEHQIRTNKEILKHFIKKKWVWRRVKKSLEDQRDEQMYLFFKEELRELRALAQTGELSLWFGDQSAFHLNPNGLYAWQEPGSALRLPARRQKGLQVLGFINKQNQGEFYDFQGAMNSDLFIQCVEDFIAKRVVDKTILVLDRSWVHTSQAVQQKRKEWASKGLYLQYLPAYCSELNYIENLWRLIKYQWINATDWFSAQRLREKVLHILKNFESKYPMEVQT